MVLFLLFGLHANSYSQLGPYQWRLGISGGFANYYGDLSPYTVSSLSDIFRWYDYNENYIPEYSYAISLERRLSPTVGLQLTAGRHSIAMSDRFVNKDGLLQLDAANFERALNFKTDIRDLGIGLVFKTDNGRFLKQNAFMAPYFNVEVGLLDFRVFGDLYDENGNAYDYGSVDQINDGIFETRLDKLNTELTEGYAGHAFYGQLGLGIRFRLTSQLELFAQSDFRHTTTDYLDDVSGAYRAGYDSPQQSYAAKPGNNIINWEDPLRGDGNRHNDWYIYHGVGIKFSFAPSKTGFRASRMSPGNYEVGARKSEIAKQEVMADSLSAIETSRPTNNYITFIQLNQPYNRDSSRYFLKMLEADLNILKWEKSRDENEDLMSRLNDQLDSLEDMRESWSTLAPDEAKSDQERAFLQQNIGKVSGQIEEAARHGSLIKEELETARQNRELYRSAYELSLSHRTNTDSVQFFNEIRGLPGAVTRALDSRGPWFTARQDSAYYPYLPDGTYSYLPDQRAATALTGPGQFLFGSTDTLRNDQEEIAGLHADLMRERARSNYLLRELRDYSGSPVYQSYVPRPYTREELEYWSGNRNGQQPEYDRNPEIRYIPDNRQAVSERRGYILPLVIPGMETRDSDHTPDNSGPTYFQGRERATMPGFFRDENNRSGPLSVKEMARLNQLGLLGFPYNFSIDNKSAVPPNLDSLRNSERTQRDTASEENPASEVLVKNKVDIYFGNDQAQPSEEELDKLDTMAVSLQNNPNWRLYISGFSDNTGNLAYNLNLINRRMNHIRNFLIEKKGIPPERITVTSGGQIVRGGGRKSSPMDRKVEVWIEENE